jgi:O-antigen/teichoic acid export membrane protein
MGENLKRQVLDGTTWSFIGSVGRQLINFVLTAILARLLLPDEFGTVGMITILAGYANVVTEMGFTAALVQRKELAEQHIQSVFWLNLAIGSIMAAAMFVSAPLIARFYGVPLLLPLTRVMSLMFLFSAPGMVPNALLRRQMAFNTLARITIIRTLVSGLLGILLAYLGAGVWSLVVSTLVFHLVSSATCLIWVGWLPRFAFSWQAIRDLWQYTIGVFGDGSITYWMRNADNVLIGRFFGPASLGYYLRVYALMLLPLTQIVSVLANVMFPALSSIKDDRDRVKRIYLRATSVLALAICPTMFGLAVVTKPFVLTVYGENWVRMVPLVPIFALVGVLQSLSAPTNWLYMSQGRTDWMFWWGLGSSGVLIASILIGIALGSLETVAWSYAIANLLVFYPAITIPVRLIGLRFRDVMNAIASPFIGSLVMASVVFLITRIIPESWPSAAHLLVLATIGVAVYGIFILTIRPVGWQDIVDLVKTRLKPFREQTSVT